MALQHTRERKQEENLELEAITRYHAITQQLILFQQLHSLTCHENKHGVSMPVNLLEYLDPQESWG